MCLRARTCVSLCVSVTAVIREKRIFFFLFLKKEDLEEQMLLTEMVDYLDFYITL